MDTNPFTFGNPIRDPARFFGRKEDLRQIVNRLLSSAHESTSVVGERRIGKTSLLKYLDSEEVAEGLGLRSSEYCTVYIDFQGLANITPVRFWDRVLGKMGRTICLPDLVPHIQEVREMGNFDLFDLEDLFEEITSQGLTTVLLFDEFDNPIDLGIGGHGARVSRGIAGDALVFRRGAGDYVGAAWPGLFGLVMSIMNYCSFTFIPIAKTL